jgi:uncharacterized membrane protein
LDDRAQVVPIGTISRLPCVADWYIWPVSRYAQCAIILACLARSCHAIRSEDSRVSIDEQHVALPKLYGAPAYARPPKLAAETARPFDPDELPLAVYQAEDEPRDAAADRGQANAAGGPDELLQPRAFSLQRLTGRLRRGGA